MPTHCGVSPAPGPALHTEQEPSILCEQQTWGDERPHCTLLLNLTQRILVGSNCSNVGSEPQPYTLILRSTAAPSSALSPEKELTYVLRPSHMQAIMANTEL